MKNTITMFLMFATCLVFGQTIQKNTYPAPGRLIDIGGRRLHLLSSGKGEPTIILEAGGGAFAIDWDLVQSRISSDARVCSYDRAGLGWSDSGPAEETVEEAVSDLHKLLKAAGEKGPFILVGASIGGIFIQAYLHKYPGEVVGLVFSNSSNRIGFATKKRTGLIWDLTEDEIRGIYPFPPSTEKRVPATKVSDPYDRLPPHLQDLRLWVDERLQEKYDTIPADPVATLSWRKEFLREFNESDAAKGRYPLGNLPVVVVASDPKANDSLRYSRSGAQARLDYLSSNSIHITATDSGHEIHLYQPDKVVEALREILMAIRKKISLSEISDVK